MQDKDTWMCENLDQIANEMFGVTEFNNLNQVEMDMAWEECENRYMETKEMEDDGIFEEERERRHGL